MKVLITGGTGFIGSHLVNKLSKSKNIELYITTRSSDNILKDNIHYIKWDPEKDELPLNIINKLDGVINLAGENIAHSRWSKKRKKKIRNSRIVTTQKLFKAINKRSIKIPFFIQGSAIGYYKHSKSLEQLDESSEKGSGFLSDLCDEWENHLNDSNKVTKKVTVRIGVVLGLEGGILNKVLPIYKRGFGGKLGSGKQWMSWIHIDDLVGILIKSITNNDYSGVINGVSPCPVTNQEFNSTLGKVLKRLAFMTVPKIILKFFMGELSTIALDSQKIISLKTKQLEYPYQYPYLEDAISNLISTSVNRRENIRIY